MITGWKMKKNRLIQKNQLIKKIDDEEELDDLPPLEGDKKKVKKGKGFYLQRKF